MAFAVGALSFVGALMQGAQQAQDLQQQANIEGYRAQVADMNAAVAGQQASAEIERQRREARQVMGAQAASIAQSGTAFSGSNLDIMRQSAIESELDTLNIQYAGELERRGLMNEAAMARYNQRNLKRSASQVMKTRWLSAVGAGVGAYGNAKGGFFLGKQPGVG